SVTAGQAALDTDTATTDANGLATVNLRPVSLGGQQGQTLFPSTITATSQYGSVNFTETFFVATFLGVADIPPNLILTPGPGVLIKVAARSPLPNGIVAQIYAQSQLCSGCPIPGVGISIVDPTNLTNDPKGLQAPISCQGSSLSDTQGFAHCTVVTKTCTPG